LVFPITCSRVSPLPIPAARWQRDIMAELLPPDLEYRPLPAQMQVPPRSTTLSPESPFSAAQSVIDTPLRLG